MKPLNWSLSSQFADALSDTDCGKWFQAGLTTSNMGATPGQSLSDFIINTLPTVTASGDFVGGSANAVTGSSLAPGYLIAFDNSGGFYQPFPKGTTIGPSDDYASQFAGINGGSGQAQVFLMLHELGHLFGMTRPDAGNAANQSHNNDEIWLNCSDVIQGFHN